jgi:molybdopterin-guanine dinucleotide biosynthesis protein A
VFDAIVLAGGAGRRLGGVDKPAELVGGRSLLERVVAAAGDAQRVVVVGPRRSQRLEVPNVIWRREAPPGSGPVAAIAAGVGETSAPTVLVLAADLPDIAPAIPRLRSAVEAGTHLALLADEEGRPNLLAAAWRREALLSALRVLGDPVGVAVRSLVAVAGAPTLVPDIGGWGRDCDTWEDLAAARRRHERRSG